MICLSAKNLKVHKHEIFLQFLEDILSVWFEGSETGGFRRKIIRIRGYIQSLKIFLFGTQFSAFEVN
jgi:hypothetical protein